MSWQKAVLRLDAQGRAGKGSVCWVGSVPQKQSGMMQQGILHGRQAEIIRCCRHASCWHACSTWGLKLTMEKQLHSTWRRMLRLIFAPENSRLTMAPWSCGLSSPNERPTRSRTWLRNVDAKAGTAPTGAENGASPAAWQDWTVAGGPRKLLIGCLLV